MTLVETRPSVNEQLQKQEQLKNAVSGFGLRLGLGGTYLTGSPVDTAQARTAVESLLRTGTPLNTQAVSKYSDNERQEYGRVNNLTREQQYTKWRDWTANWLETTNALQQTDKKLYERRVRVLREFGIDVAVFTTLATATEKETYLDRAYATHIGGHTNTDVIAQRLISASRSSQTTPVSVATLVTHLDAVNQFLSSYGENAQQAIRELVILKGFQQAEKEEQDVLLTTVPGRINDIKPEQKWILTEIAVLDKPEAAAQQPHPSETFPWPEKDEYIRKRNQQVSVYWQEAKEAIEQVEDFKYRDKKEITEQVAKVYARTSFIYNLMKENNPAGYSIPITGRIAGDIPSKEFIAVTTPVFTLGGKVVENELQVAPEDIKRLELMRINIYFFLNSFGDDIKKTEDIAKEKIAEGEPKDVVARWRDDTLNKIGIGLERAMVEEMAHAFFVIDAAKDPEKLRKHIEEIKKYWKASKEPMTAEEKQWYVNSSLEKDGEIWVKAFMQRYYPEVAYKDLASRAEETPPMP